MKANGKLSRLRIAVVSFITYFCCWITNSAWMRSQMGCQRVSIAPVWKKSPNREFCCSNLLKNKRIFFIWNLFFMKNRKGLKHKEKRNGKKRRNWRNLFFPKKRFLWKRKKPIKKRVTLPYLRIRTFLNQVIPLIPSFPLPTSVLVFLLLHLPCKTSVGV